MLETLSYIGEIINNNNITWGVGGSLLLKIHNLIDNPNDIDILVSKYNATHLNKILLPLGKRKEVTYSAPFRTSYFTKYCINNIGIDIMGGFAIEHAEGIYKLSFHRDSIVAYQKINGVDIPLCSLEDWYILYCLIPNRQDKLELLEKYFKTNGIQHARILENALMQPLPAKIKAKVLRLLNQPK
ncbi:hypothetical protein [Virgibacillus oceani]|uniref:Uncharacterized protein n=1 Tax=Virgibacillus oceani TaxID=1479511 RepID=A0A917H9N6_9BACI|nr:hypothetical protein [Virgibacillus oceani]GGG72110.1 hypothetical protein GCM10011398_15570 [Virgibacillus oceani]